LLHNRFWNLTADRVGLLAVTNFLFHSSAGDGPHFGARNPSLASNGAAGWFGGMAATFLWIIEHTLEGRSCHLLRFRNPVTGAERNFFRFGHRLADSIADIAVASLDFRTIGRAADFPVACFTHRLADRAANVTVTRLEAGLPDRAADVFVAGLEAGLTHGAADVFVTRLEAGLPHSAADVFVAGLIHRLIDRVTFVVIARFLNVPSACHRNLLGACFINRPATIDRTLFVDGFTDRLVTGTAKSLCRTVIAARITCCR
jgi:hypothetical protein